MTTICVERRIADFGNDIPGARKHLAHDGFITKPPRAHQPRRFKFKAASAEGLIFVHKEGDRLRRALHEFPSWDAAKNWRADPGYDFLAAKWLEVYRRDFISDRSLRGIVNNPRVGPDYRDGDVSPEQFLDDLQPYGVQFGLWQDNRDACLNEAYDALNDLARFLGFPVRGLLAGHVGLAFGARGHGGAMAHYEPRRKVINLTRTKGAGCLGHEWFHAFDHRISNYGLLSSAPQLIEAVAALPESLKQRSIQADRTRSRAYFSTPWELLARAFESWIRQHIRNDFLCNVLDPAQITFPSDRYPYAVGDELEVVTGVMQKLFS